SLEVMRALCPVSDMTLPEPVCPLNGRRGRVRTGIGTETAPGVPWLVSNASGWVCHCIRRIPFRSAWLSTRAGFKNVEAEQTLLLPVGERVPINDLRAAR